MKKWLKRNGRWVITGFSGFMIAFSVLGIIMADARYLTVLHIAVITFWLVVILSATGIFEKVFEWWAKD